MLKSKIMEITQEKIDSLLVNEVEIMKKIADELQIRTQQVSAVISLVNEGCTLPFIARYRKEKHDNLNEVQISSCDHLFKTYKNLEERRLEIVRGIFAQGKLNSTLFDAVMNAKTLAELEDLWSPFKKKKKTRGMVAIEKGLEPLADEMTELSDEQIEKKAQSFLKSDENPDLAVLSVKDALNGAMDILAERTSQNTENRARVHELYVSSGEIKTKGIVAEGQTEEEARKLSKYQMYWDYSEPLCEIKPHRILAISRAEREGALSVSIDVPVDEAVEILKKKTCRPPLCAKFVATKKTTRILTELGFFRKI